MKLPRSSAPNTSPTMRYSASVPSTGTRRTSRGNLSGYVVPEACSRSSVNVIGAQSRSMSGAARMAASCRSSLSWDDTSSASTDEEGWRTVAAAHRPAVAADARLGEGPSAPCTATAGGGAIRQQDRALGVEGSEPRIRRSALRLTRGRTHSRENRRSVLRFSCAGRQPDRDDPDREGGCEG